jgi:hypothetical protein
MMSNLELTKPADSTNAVHKNDASPNSALHQAAFSSPDEFLNILQNNFSALSHGHEQLALPDLQVDATDSSLSPTLRQAASIAAKNFSQLQEMSMQQSGSNGDTLSKSNLSSIDDMAKGKILGQAVRDIALEVVGGGATASVGVVGGEIASDAFGGGVGATLASGAIGTAAVGFAGVAMVVGSVAATGYLAYRLATEHKQLSSQADNDAKQISQWIK